MTMTTSSCIATSQRAVPVSSEFITTYERTAVNEALLGLNLDRNLLCTSIADSSCPLEQTVPSFLASEQASCNYRTIKETYTLKLRTHNG